MYRVYRDLECNQANKARVAVLNREIERMRVVLKELSGDVQADGMTVRYGREKIGKTGSHTDPTGEIAVRDEPSKAVQELMHDIKRATLERTRLQGRIENVQAALDFLDQRERTVVELRVFRALSWIDVSFEYEDQTGHSISDKTCQKVFGRALKRIEPFFEFVNVTDGKHEDCRGELPGVRDELPEKRAGR